MLTNHMLSGYHRTSNLTDCDKYCEFTTVEKELMLVLGMDNTVIVTKCGSANLTIPDVSARNGVVHVIDEVLLPEAICTSDKCHPNIAQVAAYAPELSTLVAALTATDLVSIVTDHNLTLLAPTNDAFSALGSERLNCLLAPVGLPALSDVLKYHMLWNLFMVFFLTTGVELQTWLHFKELMVSRGDDGTVTIIGDGSIIGGGSANIIKGDMMRYTPFLRRQKKLLTSLATWLLAS